MAWEECVTSVQAWDPNAKDMENIDWSTIPQEALEENTFDTGDPFVIICPGRHCIEGVNQTPAAHRLCQCKDINGNPIPGCTPSDLLYPFKGSICFNVETEQYSQLQPRQCFNQGNNWYYLSCYCCCSCFAYDTKIGIPGGGFKVIQNFSVGDKVLTANVEFESSGIKLEWLSAKVSFSQGTGPDTHQPAMVYIHHGNARSIIVTPDHVFLLSSGKLKRANRLVPGIDQLVSADGEPVPIHEVSIGEHEGGVHHIATNKEFTGDISGHLLLSEGIVSGDFNLQIRADALKERYFVANHDELPKIGTPEYQEVNPGLASDYYATVKSQTAPAASQIEEGQSPPMRKFYVHGKRVGAIPETAAKFLSPLQVIDVNDNAERYSFDEMARITPVINYTLKLIGGFYPNIVFYHDTGRLEPNAYAFTQYGQQIVVLSGGLTRIKGIGQEGLSIILGHLIARLQKSPPLGYHGYTSVAMADYYASPALMSVYFGNAYQPIYRQGVTQIEQNIFKHISSDHDQYQGDPYSPSTETRLNALDAGYAMDFPPPGIGGPTRGGLQLTGATASPPQLQPSSFITYDIDAQMAQEVYQQLQEHQILDFQGILNSSFNVNSDLSFLFACQPENQRKLLIEEVRYVLLHAGASIQVSFNIAVNPQTAMDEDDYELEPAAKVFTAQVSLDDPSVVVLTAQIERNVEYTLTVAQYVKAANGSTLDLETNTTKFSLV